MFGKAKGNSNEKDELLPQAPQLQDLTPANLAESEFDGNLLHRSRHESRRYSEVILSIRSVMGSGSGATRMSHFFKMAGSRSTSKYSGLIRILPGPSGNMVVSMCIGLGQRLSIS